MLLTTPKIERLNYQLVRVIIALKCKLKKGQEPSKTLCVTGISGTLDYTAPFTSVIINSYNRILKTSVKDYNSQSDIPSLIFPTNKLRNNSFNSFQSLRFLNMTNSHYCPYSGNNLDNEESIFCWSRFVSEEGRDEMRLAVIKKIHEVFPDEEVPGGDPWPIRELLFDEFVLTLAY